MTTQDRSSLDAEPLSRALVHQGGLWTDVRVVAETGSTNADLLAGGGMATGAVLVAESQTAGRGRQGRSWISPAGSALTFSLLLRPEGVHPSRWPWLPLLAGVALATAVTRICVRGVRLKWPNDLLAVTAGEESEPGKLAGVLTERSGDAVVIGIGLNVTSRVQELPAGGTSLAAAGARWVSRQQMLVSTLREFEPWYERWLHANGDPDACGIRPVYRRLSATLGQAVRVELPGGDEIRGTARDVDDTGRLVVATEEEDHTVSAGDVVHLR